MDTNSDKNIETRHEKESSGGFWHGGWAYLIFFLGLVAIMAAVSYVLKMLI